MSWGANKLLSFSWAIQFGWGGGGVLMKTFLSILKFSKGFESVGLLLDNANDCLLL